MTPVQLIFHENIKQIAEFSKRAASDKFAKLIIEASVKKCHLILEVPGFKIHPDTIDLLKDNEDLSCAVFQTFLSLVLSAL